MNGKAIAGIGLSVLAGLVLAVSANSQRIVPPIPPRVLPPGPIIQPRKLRGVESNGMVVAASVPPNNTPVLAGFLEDVPVGSPLK